MVGAKLNKEEVYKMQTMDFVMDPTFTRVVSVKTEGIIKPFVVKDYILKANIGDMNWHFRRFFLDKVEEEVGQEVSIYELEKNTFRPCLVKKLKEFTGREEVNLAQLLFLVEKQANGEEGALTLTDTNAAYVRGLDNNLWLITMGWSESNRHWFIDAGESDHVEAAGTRFLS